MKKAYISPKTEIVMVENSPILSSSTLPSISELPFEPDGPEVTEGLSRRFCRDLFEDDEF